MNSMDVNARRIDGQRCEAGGYVVVVNGDGLSLSDDASADRDHVSRNSLANDGLIPVT